MKFFINVNDNCSELEDEMNAFLDEHPGIIIHSHQFSTCGTAQKNKYVTLFYDEAPNYLTIKNKKDDTGEERTL